MGDTRRLSTLSSGERNSAGVGTFRPSFSFKDFHQPARLYPPPAVTQDGDLWPLGPALSLEGVRHPRWGGERGEPGLYLPRGPAGHLFFQLLVVANVLRPCGGDVLQPCQGGRTVAAQLGCNIPPSSSLSWRGRQRGSACALWSDSLFGFNSWFASLEREREREPSGGRVRPGTMAAAAEVTGGSPGVRLPAGSPVRRLFIPAGTEPEFCL
jgi:hypothetical protein